GDGARFSDDVDRPFGRERDGIGAGGAVGVGGREAGGGRRVAPRSSVRERPRGVLVHRRGELARLADGEIRRAVDEGVYAGGAGAKEVAEAAAVERQRVEVRLVLDGEADAAGVGAVHGVVGEDELALDADEERELAADEEVEPAARDGPVAEDAVAVDLLSLPEDDGAPELDVRGDAAGRVEAEEALDLEDVIPFVEPPEGARERVEGVVAVEVRVLPVEGPERAAEAPCELVPELGADAEAEVAEDPTELAGLALVEVGVQVVGAGVELAAVGGGAAAGAEEEGAARALGLRGRAEGGECHEGCEGGAGYRETRHRLRGGDTTVVLSAAKGTAKGRLPFACIGIPKIRKADRSLGPPSTHVR